jgi:NADH dehydrogenase
VGAARVARLARRTGVEHFVHISGIGADPKSRSLYIAKRGEGEDAVTSVLPHALILRSAVMFGPDDAFLNTIVRLVRTLPVYPMFGRGDTQLQPAFVEDVGEAVARVLARGDARGGDAYELGGPRVVTYRQLLQTIAERLDKRPVLLPCPFGYGARSRAPPRGCQSHLSLAIRWSSWRSIPSRPPACPAFCPSA